MKQGLLKNKTNAWKVAHRLGLIFKKILEMVKFSVVTTEED